MVILPPDTNGIAESARLLRAGELVAFPTETVYGLGADAMNAEAVARIFRAKGRPADNPLIVHIADRKRWSDVASGASEAAEKLMARFWPGPLTLVLERKPIVPAIVSAGLPTVAVRMPDHPIALDLIAASGVPVAAPSANRSGGPSPTTAEHVAGDYVGSRFIAAVVDGGPCRVGVESTVLDATGERLLLLRPGGVSIELLAAVIGYEPAPSHDEDVALSPGMRHAHYRPHCRVALFPPCAVPRVEDGDGVVACSIEPPLSRYSRRVDSIEEYARMLYALFREADAAGVKTLHCEEPDATGLGLALRDRLRRASGD